MTKPVVLQMGGYPEWDETPLNAAYDVRRYFEASNKAAFLADCGADVQAIATRGELGASRAIIEACPNLRIIAVYGVGYDAVDLAACRERGIRVTNTPDVLTGDVADLGVAMMMAVARGIVGAEAWVRSGDWVAKGNYPLQRRIWGKSAGILGLGRIGHEIAQRLRGFGMDIAYSDVVAKDYATDLTFIPDPTDLARRSEFLFVALAASAETRHIVSTSVIDALGPDGVLINVSRASNIDEAALIQALVDGRLGAAALDVFTGEPAIDPRFIDLPNVLLQPHQASGTVETRKAMGTLVRDNLAAFFAGQPLPTPVQ